MRKTTIIAICIMCLTGVLNSCRNTDSTPKETTNIIKSEIPSDTNTSNREEKKKTIEKSDTAESDMSWRQFLKDYEAWADTYVEFMKKYKDNPTDMSLISDYSKFLQQTAEWAEKSEKYQNDLENISPEILGEYVEALGRITKKIVEIAY